MAEQIPGSEKKVVAGVLGILLGGLGIHKFYLGYTTAGIIMLSVSIFVGAFTCGSGYGLMGLIGLIEGIIYLTKSDADFVATYVTSKREWF
jgi:TM2 domain-containing membrane protein YozV